MPRRTTAAPNDPRITNTAENYQGAQQNNGGFQPGSRTGQQANTSSPAQGNFNAGRYGGENNADNPTPYQPTPQQTWEYDQQSRQGVRPSVTSETTPYASEGRQDAPQVEAAMNGNQPRPEQRMQPIGKDQIRKAFQTLQKYKQGKQHLEDKIVRNEKWWKIRHWDLMETRETAQDPKPASGWLFNTIIAKHADFMDNYPDPVILPREINDREEAQRLSSIIPVVLEQVGFRDVFSNEVWYKLKHGTGIFGCFWDGSALNGLGDISVKDVDILSLFWEPGIRDIQKSKNLFYVELVDNDIIEASYPQARGQLHTTEDDSIKKKYMNDDSVDTQGKSLVVDWYYHKNVNGKKTLQFCKFTGDIVLYATENQNVRPTADVPVTDEYGNMASDQYGLPITQKVEAGPSIAETGLYDHGMYPFIFDPLFPETDMPVGFGFVDVCKNPQATIDILNNAFEKNAQFGASPRWFVRDDGGINRDAFLNPSEPFVSVDGNLGEDDIRVIDPPAPIQGSYLDLLTMKIDEMKEVTGNRDVTNGGTTAGATAASAIAALQESSGKTSRDQIATTYSAYKKLVTMIIELIRQFYDMPRQFRIIGRAGQEQFATYSNENLQPQYQGDAFGEDMGYRLPVFDVEVQAEKASAYSRLSQNELALNFYNSGFFAPQQADQALACLEMMDFSGKDEMINKVRSNGGMYQQMLNMQQQMLMMGQIIDQLAPGRFNMASIIADEINQNLDQQAALGEGNISMQTIPEARQGSNPAESNITKNARQRAADTTSPT